MLLNGFKRTGQYFYGQIVADIRFLQCERTYSKRGCPPRFALGSGGQHSRLDPDMASIFKASGANVVSLASNHAMDWGPEALEDTIDLFHRFQEVLEYTEWVSDQFPHRFKVEGNEVVVQSPD